MTLKRHSEIAVILIMMGFLLATCSAFGQGRLAQANSALAIQIRPAAQIQMSSEIINVKVRLAKGALAYIWAAAECSIPAPVVVVEHSGTYDFANAMFAIRPGDRSLCVASSDGSIMVSAPLVIAPPETR